MSMFRINTQARATTATPSLQASVQKRFLHRAPDYSYMSIWKKSQIDFVNKLSPVRPSEWDAGVNLYNSPVLVEKILHTLVALKERGLVPFLHAMPAGSRVQRKLMETVYPDPVMEEKRFTYLRPPTPSRKIPHEKAWKSIPLEERQEAKENLISMSYGLTSGIKPLESAASWGFVNYFGKEQWFSLMDQCNNTLKQRNLTKQQNDYFTASIRNLIVRYNRLKVGRFLAIGIPPEKVERFAYDSAPYNVPTGRNVLDVATAPEKHTDTLMAQGTHFATLVISEETLDVSSGIVIVDATNAQEVDTFCGHDSFVPMEAIENYVGLVSPINTDFEKCQQKEREKIDAELDNLIYLLNHMEEQPDIFETIPDSCATYADYPEQSF